jgi:uncharacterized membrane protein YkvA (DUF1232 family)
MGEKDFFRYFNLPVYWRDLVELIKSEEYKVPLIRKLTYLAGIIYIIIPFDFIPGIFPLVGIIDDAGVLAFLIGLLVYEIDSYRQYRELHGTQHHEGEPTEGGKT